MCACRAQAVRLCLYSLSMTQVGLGTYLLTRYAKISSKAKPEPRPQPHEIWWTRHQARPASLKHRTKPGSQCVIHCDRFPKVRHEPNTHSSGSAKARPGLNFGPGRAAAPELCISYAIHTTAQKMYKDNHLSRGKNQQETNQEKSRETNTIF